MNSQDSGEDRISALPDDMIGSILTYLHVEESVRTSILSKRWRNIWLSSPITISDESIAKQSCIYCSTEEESSSWIINVISYIINTHPGPIPTFHFKLRGWRGCLEYETLVNLLKRVTLKGIRNLQMDFNYSKVPCFVLECDSLADVQLGYGSMPAQLPTRKNIFPNLRKLTLTECVMDNDFLVNLLSSRSIIIELALIGCTGFTNVVIESDCLQKLRFRGNGEFCDFNLTIKDVPNLATFKCTRLSRRSKVVILNAHKLKNLSHFKVNMRMLQLGDYQFDFYARYVQITGEIPYLSSLRSLDIVVNFNRGYEAKSIMRFLMLFPCLETLRVSTHDISNIYFSDYAYYYSLKSKACVNDFASIVADADYEDYVMSNINCLTYHLKHVSLKDFYVMPAHLEFARLIVANAKVLETLTITYGSRC